MLNVHPLEFLKKPQSRFKAKTDILKLSILGNQETISTQVGGIHAHLMHLKIKEHPGLLNEKYLVLAMERIFVNQKKKCWLERISGFQKTNGKKQ